MVELAEKRYVEPKQLLQPSLTIARMGSGISPVAARAWRLEVQQTIGHIARLARVDACHGIGSSD